MGHPCARTEGPYRVRPTSLSSRRFRNLAEDRGVAAENRARAEVSRRLVALIAESGLTAAEFAARLGLRDRRCWSR